MRLHREKGSDFIPNFAQKVLPAVANLHLLVGGVGPLEASIKSQLAGTPYGSRVHFVGWQDDTPTFLSACDFFWSLSREESFPQTLVEASAMGLPWVAPNTGGVSELSGNGAVGKLYPRLNIAAASQATSELLQGLKTRQEQARAALPGIHVQYSLGRMIEKVYAVFERYADRRQANS